MRPGIMLLDTNEWRCGQLLRAPGLTLPRQYGQARAVSEPTPIPLASAIRALRAELQDAMSAGAGEQLRFALGSVELELQVQAASEGAGEASIKFWVVSIGGRGGRSSEATHTLRLSLTPVRVGAGGDRDADVLVASDLEPRD